MKYGKTGAFGELLGLLFGRRSLPSGIGPVLVAGPVVAWIVGALEGAALVEVERHRCGLMAWAFEGQCH